MPAFFMKLLLGKKKRSRSLRMPYGFVALGFLQRWRQPHLKLLPVPTGSPDREGANHGETSPCSWHSLTPMSLWMHVFLLRIQQSLIGSFGRFLVNYIISNHSLVPGVGDTLVSKAETLTSGNLCLFGQSLFPKECFSEPSSLGKL